MSTTPEALASPDAPVVPAPEQPDGAAPETGNVAESSPAAANTSESTEPEAKWVQKRIDELTKYRHEAERRERDAAKERDHWRELALKNQTPQKPAEVVNQKPKTLADFSFDEGQYHAYLLGEASKAATEAARKELQTEQETRARQEQASSYVKRAKEFAKSHQDYKEVAEGAPISDKVAEIILGLESGPEVAYYLGKNPEMAQEISRLPDRNAAFELGQISARLAFEREKAASAKNIISSAPPPTPKIEGGGVPGTVKVDTADSDKLSDAEWTRRRNAQEQARLRKLRNG